MEDSEVSQQAVNALLNLQAYHAATFMKDDPDDDDFYLIWGTWMRVTLNDLMKFQLKSKQRADWSEKWDCDHHVGKYKIKVPTDTPKVEYENNKKDRYKETCK